MIYEDRPVPGSGFLLFVHAFWSSALLLAGLALFRHGRTLHQPDLIAAVLSLVVGALVSALLLGLAYRTVFTLEDGTLTLRSGGIYRKIRVERIRRLSRVPSWRHWFRPPYLRRQGFCNRFSDYVLLELDHDSVVFTPSDPERFIAWLRESRPELAAGTDAGEE